MKTLVVYYSRTGNTRRVARRIARELDADLEEIEDRTSRGGVTGFMRSGKDSLLHHTTDLAEPDHRPGDYDLVVVGTPVWAGRLSPPVRTWLECFRDELSEAAFFLTTYMFGKTKTFTAMEEVSGRSPRSNMALTASELKSEEWVQRVDRFVEELRP